MTRSSKSPPPPPTKSEPAADPAAPPAKKTRTPKAKATAAATAKPPKPARKPRPEADPFAPKVKRKRKPKLGPDGQPVEKKPRKVVVPARALSPRPWQARRGHLKQSCAVGVEAFCDVMLDLKPRGAPLTEESTAYLKGLREWARGNATGHGLEETTRQWLKSGLLVPPAEGDAVRALVKLRAIVHSHPGKWEKLKLTLLDKINDAARPTTPERWKKEPAPDLGPTWHKRLMDLMVADAADAVRRGAEAKAAEDAARADAQARAAEVTAPEAGAA